MENSKRLLEVDHHCQLPLCKTRPAYRQGRKLTAVKTYTISSESAHLFVYGVPKINLRPELKRLCANYGQILSITATQNYKTEIFTECYHVRYKRIQSARIAKRFLDNRSFYGGCLHVCYSPEYESLEETRQKLWQRTKDVMNRLYPSNNKLHFNYSKNVSNTNVNNGMPLDPILMPVFPQIQDPATPATPCIDGNSVNTAFIGPLPEGSEPLSYSDDSVSEYSKRLKRIAQIPAHYLKETDSCDNSSVQTTSCIDENGTNSILPLPQVSDLPSSSVNSVSEYCKRYKRIAQIPSSYLKNTDSCDNSSVSKQILKRTNSFVPRQVTKKRKVDFS